MRSLTMTVWWDRPLSLQSWSRKLNNDRYLHHVFFRNITHNLIDTYNRGVRIPWDDVWHDWSVYHAQSGYPVDSKFRINYRCRIGIISHFASACLMVQRGRIVSQKATPIIVCPHWYVFTSRERFIVKSWPETLKSWCVTQGQSNFHSFDHDF